MKYLLLFLVILFSWMITPFHSAKSLQYVYESYQGSPYSWKFRKSKGKFRAQARAIWTTGPYAGMFHENPYGQYVDSRSQKAANEGAVDKCRKAKETKANQACVLTMQGDYYVGEQSKKQIIEFIRKNPTHFPGVVVADEKKQTKQPVLKQQQTQNVINLNNDQDFFNTCKKYGFKEGTEKFGECILKVKELAIQQAQIDAQKRAEINSRYQSQVSEQQRAMQELQRQQAIQQYEAMRQQNLHNSLMQMYQGLCIAGYC